MSWLAPILLLPPLVLGSVCDEAVGPSTNAASSSFLQHSLQLDGTLDRGESSKPQQGPRKVTTHSLFVKYHKVAGQTWRAYTDMITGESEGCSANCGDLHWACLQKHPDNQVRYEHCQKTDVYNHLKCEGSPTSCTFHQSIEVMRQAVLGQNLTVANASDLAGVQNLWPDAKRFGLLWNVEWTRVWLPPFFDHKRLLVTTLLREPVERIRSYYYFVNTHPSHELFLANLRLRRDYVAGNMTQRDFNNRSLWGEREGGPSMPILLRSCCEYEAYLGEESVERSILALTTQFDLVAITERLSEGLVTLGRMYGLSASEIAAIGRRVGHKNEGSRKLDWLDEELRLATYMANKSTQIYNFAQKLFDRQSMSLFGTPKRLKEAVATFERLNPSS